MSLQTLFLSPQGRQSRAPYAAGVFSLSCLVASLGKALAKVDAPAQVMTLKVLTTAIFLGVGYSLFALTIKRLHDLGRSGWLSPLYATIPSIMILIPVLAPQLFAAPAEATSGGTLRWVAAYLVPAVAAVLLIELLARRGEAGANAYGPEPTGEV